MSLSNYPPGVSGGEDAIAGPRAEQDLELTPTCPECHTENSIWGTLISYTDSQVFHYQCPNCGANIKENVTDEFYD